MHSGYPVGPGSQAGLPRAFLRKFLRVVCAAANLMMTTKTFGGAGRGSGKNGLAWPGAAVIQSPLELQLCRTASSSAAAAAAAAAAAGTGVLRSSLRRRESGEGIWD